MVRGMHLTPLGRTRVLLEPDEGLDPSAPDLYLPGIIAFMRKHGASELVYDLGKLPIVDSVYYGWLCMLASACTFSGVTLRVVRMRPSAAFALSAGLDADPPFACSLDIASG